MTITDTERILPSIHDGTETAKKYVLRLEPDGTALKVRRGIICPSNIGIPYLSEFLTRTMGRVGTTGTCSPTGTERSMSAPL